jgi:hypothetical protein
LAIVILTREKRTGKIYDKTILIILISGAVVQLVAYMGDYVVYLHGRKMLEYLFSFSKPELITEYLPNRFPWLIYIVGEVLILFAIRLVYRKGRDGA